MPDDDGYPTGEELARIRAWPKEQGWKALLEYVQTCWWAADWGWSHCWERHQHWRLVGERGVDPSDARERPILA